MTRAQRQIILVSLALQLLLTSIGLAGDLRKLVDKQDVFPENGESVSSFNFLHGNSPALSGRNIAFGAATPTGGYYALIDGQLRIVMNTLMPVPVFGGTFGLSVNSSPAISGSNVAFLGFDAQGSGAWVWRDGVLENVVHSGTPVPGKDDQFRSFSIGEGATPAISGDNVAFVARTESGGGGIYAYIDGELRIIADLDTQVPGLDAGRKFTNFGNLYGASPDISGANVVFEASSGFDHSGLFAYIDGQLRVIAATGTPKPEGGAPFCGTTFGGFSLIPRPRPSISGENVAFTTGCGIYAYINGEIRRIADRDTVIPGTTTTMGGFNVSPTISGENVVFSTNSAPDFGEGIFAYIDGEIELIASTQTRVPGSDETFVGFFQAPTRGPGGVRQYISGKNVIFGAWPAAIYSRFVPAVPELLSEFAILQRCFTGDADPTGDPPPPLDSACTRFDTNADNLINQTDYTAFLEAHNTP